MWTHIYSPVSDTYTLQYKSCMPVSVSVLEDPSTHVQTLLYTHSSGRSQTSCSSEFVSFLNIADRICPCLSAGDTLIKSPYLQKHREASGGKWSKHVFVCESVLTVFCALETEREGNHDPSWSAAIFFQCLNFFQNCLKCCFCTASSLSRLYLVTVRACCDLMPECRLLWILYAEATVHVVISGLSESCIKLWLDWTIFDKALPFLRISLRISQNLRCPEQRVLFPTGTQHPKL